MADAINADFATRLLAWWDAHGRKDLPWQLHRTPYRVWVSEVMLQQTQVTAVVPYFERFMVQFPTLTVLAEAELDAVLHVWSGLGYYARARSLHHTAQIVARDLGGRLPDTEQGMAALPGIGRSTAAAIIAQSFDRRAPILDGNVKRVLARCHRVAGPPSSSTTQKALWAFAQAHTPEARAADYTQAIMDLGATLCRPRQPNCPVCPVRSFCQAFASGDVERYPERASRRNRRLERRRFFVLTAPDGACYVERRPAKGIWGGLWSPPECDGDAPAAETLLSWAVSPRQIESCRVATVFRHGFTHFDLDVEPVYVRLTERPASLPGAWITPDDHRLGLSVVAAKLLAATQQLELEP